MILSFLYFVFPTCAVLYYAIGINKVIIVSDELPSHTLTGIKSSITVISSVILTFLFTNAILVPVNLTELFPIFALLIFISISILIEVLVRITAKQSASEFTVSFLTVILSLSESITLSESIFIALSYVFSFYNVAFLVHIIKRRVTLSKTPDNMTNSSLIFLSMAFLIIILSFINITWLNPGVLK